MPRAARREVGSQLLLDRSQADDPRVRGAGRRGAPLVVSLGGPEVRSRLDSRGVHRSKDLIVLAAGPSHPETSRGPSCTNVARVLRRPGGLRGLLAQASNTFCNQPARSRSALCWLLPILRLEDRSRALKASSSSTPRLAQYLIQESRISSQARLRRSSSPSPKLMQHSSSKR